MIGPLSVGKNAAKAGYKRFGKKGALAGGLAGVGGYVLVKRTLERAATTDDADTTAGTESAEG